MHETFIKSQAQHFGAPLQEGFAPAPQRLGIVRAKMQLVHNAQPGAARRFAKAAGAGQAATGKYVLLDEVGGVDIAVEQGVVDDDALDAGTASRLEQAADSAKVGRPVRLSHGLDHLD